MIFLREYDSRIVTLLQVIEKYFRVLFILRNLHHICFRPSLFLYKKVEMLYYHNNKNYFLLSPYSTSFIYLFIIIKLKNKNISKNKKYLSNIYHENNISSSICRNIISSNIK